MSVPQRGALPLGLVDVFAIGVGPSSSHTVGPMRAALDFVGRVLGQGGVIEHVGCELFGSLALTGRGHATDVAVLLGLEGHAPDTFDPDLIDGRIAAIRSEARIMLGGRVPLPFAPEQCILFRHEFLPFHPNGMRLEARFTDGRNFRRTYYSIGGGAILSDDAEAGAAGGPDRPALPHPFYSARGLLALCEETGLDIAGLMLANETVWRSREQTIALVDSIRAAMLTCIDRGVEQEGILPGGLGVRRRARQLHRSLLTRNEPAEPAAVLEWVSLWALAVNEENAAGGRVVTAPTNGAAGVIPAVLRYYERFVSTATPEGSRKLLLTAAAIGILYKIKASISAAEMGCQGEVGVACSMASAGLAAALGGTGAQIENAAEIGMEHNLGLTCDPIGGLVQIPCIERNTMGAIKAINAALLALNGDGSHKVSLDTVIETMRQTGCDMQTKYKETSLGGLAVNVVEC